MIEEWIRQLLLTGPEEAGVLLLVGLALSTFVSEDLTCIVAGILASRGAISFLEAVVACFIGIFVGDALVFYTGAVLGRQAVERRPLSWWISKESLEVSTAWFARRGPMVIMISRFLPGTRFPTYIASGTLGMSFGKFAGYFALAGVLWTPLLVGLAMQVGAMAETYIASYDRAARWFILALLSTWVLLRMSLPLFTHRGRRLLKGDLKRWTTWEFFPTWLTYLPVGAYIALQAMRHRSVTVFSAANPAIPGGGFIGESKAAILDALTKGRENIATYRLLPAGSGLEEQVARVETFIEEEGLSFPIVLKPNQGQRGAGVRIAKSREDVVDYFRHPFKEVLVQAFAPGKEFGVYYYRHPKEARGHILSVTEKILPELEGDGQHTLEELILNDERAVCMARFYLKANRHRLYDVPSRGESVQLVELGTHCRGAIFRDGAWVMTAALLETLDAMCHSFEGFYFGRFDIRTPCLEDFREGRNFKVVELNGVTSEATHIYDPAVSLLEAYRVLFRQWRLAFEIGAANRAAGVKVASATELLRDVRSFVAPPEVT